MAYYHLPEGNTYMIADVIPAMIGTKTPASLQTQDLQAGLRHQAYQAEWDCKSLTSRDSRLSHVYHRHTCNLVL